MATEDGGAIARCEDTSDLFRYNIATMGSVTLAIIIVLIWVIHEASHVE